MDSLATDTGQRPNFFILGAPKAGTTAMAQWLSEHPDVFMSAIKEPQFFNADHGGGFEGGLAEYLKLFAAASARHRVIGEGTVWYLYSRVAVKTILDVSPSARFLVMLRNPVDRSWPPRRVAV